VNDAPRPRPSRLVIDDARTFAFDAFYARSSRAGIAALTSLTEQREPLDELWLDYHLGGGDHGGLVVDWLVAHAVEAVPLIGVVWCHSSDGYAANLMLRALNAAGYTAERGGPRSTGRDLR
jgi:hypothetical protein